VTDEVPFPDKMSEADKEVVRQARQRLLAIRAALEETKIEKMKEYQEILLNGGTLPHG
jgi:hypothetical protein